VRYNAAILIVLALSGCGESRSSSFRTLQEAKESGLIEKGWIPPQIPPDATDIRVSWNLDTNVSEGSYQSKGLVAPLSPGECQPRKTTPGIIECGEFFFRTENGLRKFSNRFS